MAKPKKRQPKPPSQPAAAPRDDATARPYEILLTPSAARALDRLTRSVFLRVDAKIQALSANPRPSGCAKLQGLPDLYRIRAGDHRVVYQIKDDELLVLVVHVGDRKVQSYVLTEMLRSLSRDRLIRRMGAVRSDTMAAVDTRVKILLGL